ncbi:MAG: helix-turn-helix transcriptional regulator, partial [Deltaproteobacteria bacterium]|nr:helix-turn-helix transcriptional regulator [Deltaproteobacteria bacterium]
MDQTDIIAKIKNLRLERGLSLNQLAKMTNLSKGYLSKIENGVNVPPIVTLYRI